ncbi:MAG: FtsW/RodA/SpoVE family cell cycle protein [Coriobacteriia bacterium]|nr:FtsW/RodA/SpoVE family cell cycle protein [Coriobacteriia bacterium]
MRSRRTTELLLLLAASPPVLLVFALVDAQRAKVFEPSALLVPGALLVAFIAAHLAVRRFAPNADPGLLPIVFVLSGIGLAVVTRLDATLAASQVTWLFVGVAALVATLVAVPSLERLARYKYTLMVGGLVLLLLPAFIGREINGAKLWIRFGGFGFQPGELAKILIVLFLAAYLAENRELLSVSTRRIFGLRLPEPRTLGPLLLMWVISLVVLVFERDLGSSLLFFAIFLVMLYAATGRAAYVVVGLVLFGAGATVAYKLFSHVRVRVDIWLHPFTDAAGKGYQLVQSLFALAAGGLTGVGLGRGLPDRIPFVTTDFIFSAIGEELGLLGAAAMVLCFLAFAVRGFATAARAKTDMAAFTAVGLIAAISLQAFVIVGGVTRLIPLTGVTLPFVSYGGSSLLSSFIALALLLRAGDEGTGVDVALQSTSADLGVLGRLALGRRLVAITTVTALLMAALVVNLTWIQVVDARALSNNPANTRNLAKQARDDRGSIVTRDGVVLAESNPAGRGTFERVYPKRTFAAHTIGYYSTRYGRTGIEAAENDMLAGGTRAFTSWSDVIDAATGRSVPGNDVVLTIDSRVQKAAEKALAGRSGAVVALDPRTGAVLAAAANPTYDPGTVDKNWDALSTDPDSPLLDRSRNALFAPGSTFKIVTLTGALSEGVATPTDSFAGPGSMKIGGAPVTNYEGGGYSKIDLTTATMKSVNTVFAQVAVKLGAPALVKQADLFGFDRELGYEIGAKTSLMPEPAEMTEWETAWAGVGQPVGEHESPAGPQATVMQMALVAAGIANDGEVMKPHVLGSIRNNLGQQVGTTRPASLSRATDPATAKIVAGIMQKVVSGGSGYRASISGTKVAGKTGTAEVGKGRPTNAWFIAFAPAENPTVALAIMIEGGGVGGQVAAPAAKPVLEAALSAQKGR